MIATVELCRHIKDRSSAAWSRFVRFSNRVAVTEFVDSEDGFILTEFFGNEPSHRTVVCIGRNPTNPNGRFCLDITLAPDDWRAMTDADLHAEIARKGTPVRRVRVNGAPTLTSLYEADDDLLNGLDPGAAEERARQFKDDPHLCARIIALYTASWADIALSAHPERQLYSGGFPSDADQKRIFDFHDATWRRRADIAAEFDDPRLEAFAGRLIHSEHRSLLDPKAQVEADARLADRLLNGRDGPLTLYQAIAETEKLMADAIGDPMGNLTEYRNYLTARLAKVVQFQAELVV